MFFCLFSHTRENITQRLNFISYTNCEPLALYFYTLQLFKGMMCVCFALIQLVTQVSGFSFVVNTFTGYLHYSIRFTIEHHSHDNM